MLRVRTAALCAAVRRRVVPPAMFLDASASSSNSADSGSSNPLTSASHLDSAAFTGDADGAGRCFDATERGCGMLFTLDSIRVTSPAAAVQHAQKNNSAAAAAVSTAVVARRLGALVKATSADWQLNEVPAPTPLLSTPSSSPLGLPESDEAALRQAAQAEPLFLTRMPKGRWRKLAGRVVKRVETDSDVPFSDPGKHFRELAVSMGTYAYRRGRVPVDRDTLEFSLYRESTPWRAVLQRMHRRLHLGGGARRQTEAEEALRQQQLLRQRVAVASPQESFGCVTQLGRVRHMSAEMLPHASRHYNINPVLFNPLRFVAGGEGNVVAVAPPVANRWRVMLRCVDGSEDEIAQALERVAQRGAINYFPLRCFGAGAPTAAASGGFAVECAVAARSGRYVDACGLWLHCEAQRDLLLQPHFRRYLAADAGALAGVLHVAAVELRDQRAAPHVLAFLEQLAKLHAGSGGVTDEACRELWERVVLASPTALDGGAALNAAPARFLWNLAASQRLYQHGCRVVVGDFVLAAPENVDGKQARQQAKVVRQVREGETSKFTIDDVVIPLPSFAGTASPSSSPSWCDTFYKEAADRFAIPATALASLREPRYRRLVLKALPGSFEYKIVADPNSLSLLKTDLFLRQERIPPQGVPLQERLREPTPFNVSDAFRERMQPVLHRCPPPSSSAAPLSASSSSRASRAGRHSVAIECDLPAGASPTHILSLLREAFLLRHMHFNDMFECAD